MRNFPETDERESWNRRYRQGSHADFEPDPFLLSTYDRFIDPLFPKGGAALDIAGGLGRHAIWLAELRWKVTVVDISEVAFKKAKDKADERDVKIDFLVRDLRQFDPGREKYDMVLVFFYLQRDLFPQLVALAPFESLTATVTKKVPATEGVPLMTPAGVMANGGGSPLAVNV